MDSYLGHLWLTRLLIQRGVAAVYLIAFIAVLLQFKPLLGERGLLPVADLLKRTTFRQLLSLFHWREYGFKGKPGNPLRMPPQVAHYHLRPDWLVWFLPFSVAVTEGGIHVWRHDLWFLRFIRCLLTNNRALLRLMGSNPFPTEPPAHIRALFYKYRYTTSREKRQTRAWCVRRQLGVYLEPVSLQTLRDI